jgi:hypothetical protein
MKRTRAELEVALRQQVKFLQVSCKAFDDGDEDEALRIASVIRVLVHDTPKSRSLLVQLGVQSKMKFIDSAEPFDPVETGRFHNGRPLMAMSGMPGLFGIAVSPQGAKIVAREDTGMYARGAVSFDEWWSDGCMPGHDGIRHSRSWLIKQMANKEGGAHVDPEVTKGYMELKTTSMGMTVQAGGISGFVNSVADVSVRQIAWELLESLSLAKLG